MLVPVSFSLILVLFPVSQPQKHSLQQKNRRAAATEAQPPI